MASVCGTLKLRPGLRPSCPTPDERPSLENFTIARWCRRHVRRGNEDIAIGRDQYVAGEIEVSGPSPVTPALRASLAPSVGAELKTWWPLPPLPRPSVTHTLPSRST